MRTNSRRGFLKQTLGVCWTTATLLEQSVFRAAHARAQARTAPSDLFDIEKVADGVYAAIARPAVLTNCNAAIFENATGVMIVDTHSKPSAAASLTAQIRRQITSKPVRYIVNTHFHWDHTQGTPAYRTKLAPHADVIASTATRTLLAEHGAARLKASVEQARKNLENYRKSLAGAKTEAEKSYYQTMASQTAAYIEEMRDYQPELPGITFDRSLVIHDKAHELHLVFRGRGHTAGDIVVHCPQKKVIATGDLFHGFFPYAGDGYPLDWPRTLYGVSMFEFDHGIGGHGAVQHTRQHLYHMASYIEELTQKVLRGKNAGRSVEELQKEITPSKLKTLEWGGYGEFVAGSLAKHAVQPPGATPSQILSNGVRGNVEQIFKRLEAV